MTEVFDTGIGLNLLLAFGEHMPLDLSNVYARAEFSFISLETYIIASRFGGRLHLGKKLA